MNIQAEKNEIIRLITELSNEPVRYETRRLMTNDAMNKKLDDSRQQIAEGKGIKIDLDEIWE